MKDFSFINFARDVGKRITVNYMMAKKIRLKKTHLAMLVKVCFTPYHQLIDNDFFHLNKEYNCLRKMAEDQCNITTGTELVQNECGNDER
jgi:tyrosyl-tRNA synthetase